MINLTLTKIANFIGHKNAIYRLLRLSNDEFLSAGADGMLVKWNINEPENGTMIANTGEPIYSICSFKNYVLLGLKSGKVFVLDLNSMLEKHQLLINKAPIHSISVLGDTVLMGTENGLLYQMDSEFKVHKKIALSNVALRCICVHKENIFVGSTDHKIYCLTKELEVKSQLIEHSETVFDLKTTKNQLISASKDARIKIWNKESLALEKSIDAHWLHVKYLDYNPQKNWILSTSMDKTIRIWDADNWELLKVIDKAKNQGHSSSVNCGLWLTKNIVISCSDDRSIMAFKIEK